MPTVSLHNSALDGSATADIDASINSFQEVPVTKSVQDNLQDSLKDSLQADVDNQDLSKVVNFHIRSQLNSSVLTGKQEVNSPIDTFLENMSQWLANDISAGLRYIYQQYKTEQSSTQKEESTQNVDVEISQLVAQQSAKLTGLIAELENRFSEVHESLRYFEVISLTNEDKEKEQIKINKLKKSIQEQMNSMQTLISGYKTQ
ncbi:hypothetical protein H0A36_01485 [Endozoicomonas sp. SM1973]|uniref:Uncharacterized protein n=1 Tax=Spartinivicinus marinus TaxID=2994442 RepID=A0A853HW69_9GAMM|nr:hypothetical protein [Spartinivicinus marinus]MCX4030096.1 hypothetical protein [Spartinivicinus marinus]NYZ64659.1 hypothetical protein [Spartinivicinus marinus]